MMENDINEKIDDLIETMKNYRNTYPRSKELEMYMLGLFYEIIDNEE